MTGKTKAALREATGLPFALCGDCAVLYTAAFPLRKVREEAGKLVTCANCRKRRPGAEYVVERGGKPEEG